MLSRRAFLAGLAATAAAGCSGGGDGGRAAGTSTTTARARASTTTAPVPDLGGPPFTLGVASGDPAPDGVVLWTRLAPDPLAATGGGVPPVDVPVRWEVAADEGFRRVVADGVATATPALGHSVHAEVAGLEPDGTYWYRFTAGPHDSPVGRTRTAPEAAATPEHMRFAFASCQNWQSGYWTAWPHVVDEDLDALVFLGDYIYEGGANPGALRQHDGPEVTTLDAYRNRYALYKGDPGLQAAHAACPWLVVWDDHEVENNYAAASPEAGDPSGFLARRALAYQAWYEHQPVRLAPPTGADFRIFRRVDWGELATFHLLDTRQYRSDQACEGIVSDIGPSCDAALDPARTMVGEEQERWLTDRLSASRATWDVLGQQVIFGPTPIPLGDTEVVNLDQWDGYPASRQRLLDALADGPANPVVITGDIHASGVGDLVADPTRPDAPVIGTELVGTSISSRFTEEFIDIVQQAADANPAVQYFNARDRGYVTVDLTAERLRADYRFVDTVDVAEAGIRTGTSWVVEAGRPGALEA